MTGLLALALVALFLGLALRADPLVYLFYALVGVYLVNRLWLQRSRQALRGRRTLGVAATGRPHGASDTSAFLGDRVTVAVELHNSGRLPLAWALVREQLPPALRPVEPNQWVVTLGPGERQTFRYTLFCSRRGYYAIGPLTASGGTPWEAERRETTLDPLTFFTVYPHIVPLARLGLPSRLPLGSRRSANPLLPDPSRLVGVRDYAPGDRLRDVHWRATARLGTLQVKHFQPSQQLDATLFLDLDAGAYDFRTRERASELAIVVAASLATFIVDQRQAVGLISNGRDPLAQPSAVDPTAPAVRQALAAAESAAAAPEPLPAGLTLPATDRLVAAASQLPPPLPRRVLATDPFAPPTIPEETYDEEASSFIDGPSIGGAPAAPVEVPMHDGRGHLASLLTVLARISLREPPGEGDSTPGLAALPFTRLVRRRAAGLPWGATLLLITAAPTPDLLPTMIHLRNSGFSPVALFVQPPRLISDLDASAFRAAGLIAYDLYDEGRLAELPLQAPER